MTLPNYLILSCDRNRMRKQSYVLFADGTEQHFPASDKPLPAIKPFVGITYALSNGRIISVFEKPSGMADIDLSNETIRHECLDLMAAFKEMKESALAAAQEADRIAQNAEMQLRLALSLHNWNYKQGDHETWQFGVRREMLINRLAKEVEGGDAIVSQAKASIKQGAA